MNICILLPILCVASVLGATQDLQQAKATTSRPTSRIVGGFPAANNFIPYIASLIAYGNHLCGGSVINKRTILTAAHCLSSMRAQILKVKVGSISRTSNDGQIYSVEAIYFHEKWSPKTMDYDIGIVRLRQNLTYSVSVKPIKIGSDSLRDGTFGTIAGWGFTRPNGEASQILRYARVPIVNPRACKLLLGNLVTERMICAGYLRGGVDSCQADSGGPLEVRNQLYGIVSWGISCALPGKPGVYTRISALLPWVQNLLRKKYNEVL